MYDQQNDKKIYPGQISRGGLYDPVRVDIFATREKNTGYASTGVEKLLRETFLPRLFFRKL